MEEKKTGPCLQMGANPQCCAAIIQRLERRTDMISRPERFVWYELMTTDVAAARAFYCDAVGWDACDASTTELVYTLFTAENAPVSGLMALPEEARRMGATPRWMGYVGVDNADATTDRIKRLGGAVYVPPTDSNIGRVAVVADPQTAIMGLVEGLKTAFSQAAGLDRWGQVGWHELLAADWATAFSFYAELFGWRKVDTESGPVGAYQLFSAGGQTIGGMFTKRPVEPIPYWLFYFNVGDIDAAAERVRLGGGQVFEGPFVVPEGSWIARCIDPQGAIFALQGKRNPEAIAGDAAAEVGWSTEWSGISSRGKLTTKPRG
jgi:predicted enzyme related to lactoylglutathione lyase